LTNEIIPSRHEGNPARDRTALLIAINERHDAQITAYADFDYQSALVGCVVQLKGTH